mmetsp:Transcript_28106/g.39525  ORF Transcript_28106/g.39525 Transcript_28106/m.39525 type:complete len:540 (+) Transcript_28106:88-1707(+)
MTMDHLLHSLSKGDSSSQQQMEVKKKGFKTSSSLRSGRHGGNNTSTTSTKSTESSSGIARFQVIPVAQPTPEPTPTLYNLFENMTVAMGISPASDEDIAENRVAGTQPGFLQCAMFSPKTPCISDAVCMATEFTPQKVVTAGCLDIGGWTPPTDNESSPEHMTPDRGTPSERRRKRHEEKMRARSYSTSKNGVEITNSVFKRDKQKEKKEEKPCPLSTLEVNNGSREMERCISELTMKSSYAGATAKLAENRRMAYYAVGKHNKSGGKGGNRRCYFTGKLILGASPFYAGSVHQGLRTLVVFCLPSALDLPRDLPPEIESLRNGTAELSESMTSHASSLARSLYQKRPGGILKTDDSRDLNAAKRIHTRSGSASKLSGLSGLSGSALSSLETQSIEEDLDPNWRLDSDYLLSLLPDPSTQLLKKMATMYPQQFATLPVQVRSPQNWQLFVKFCFFSGLPIAEGEMHYKVSDSIACESFGEDIVLSHEVMEAVNGESAEMLRLPNKKTFRYLRKHYTQQCSKLPSNVFERRNWELVLPEI